VTAYTNQPIYSKIPIKDPPVYTSHQRTYWLHKCTKTCFY